MHYFAFAVPFYASSTLQYYQFSEV